MRKLLLAVFLLSCQPVDGGRDIVRTQGPPGPQGPMGEPGKDGVSAADATGKSGARIKVLQTRRTLTSEDGATVETAPRSYQLYDSKLDTACAAGLAEDRVLRCLPLGFDLGAAVHFEDAACSKPFGKLGRPAAPCGGSPPPLAAPKYLREQPAAMECDPQGVKIYRSGAEVTPVLIYERSGAACKVLPTEQADALRAQWRFFVVGARVAPAEFAGLIEQEKQVEAQ